MNTRTSCGIVNAVRMASLTPAERVGLHGQVGSLEPRKRADVLCLDADLGVQRVFVGGSEFNAVSAAAEVPA